MSGSSLIMSSSSIRCLKGEEPGAAGGAEGPPASGSGRPVPVWSDPVGCSGGGVALSIEDMIQRIGAVVLGGKFACSSIRNR